MKSIQYLFKEWIIPIVIALTIVLLLNKFVFVLVTVPTSSMEKTIMPNDRLFVSKIYDVDDFERKDIIVFDSSELNKVLVKRLIGMPNDQIFINSSGQIFINDEKLDEPYAVQGNQKEQYFQVPEGSYFFLGDNRPYSLDARSWQNPYISEEDILGVAVFRFFPFNRAGKIE
ncbi:MAG: signal peptidase I [Tissierellales bacterium]|nr:signal peptidase I [Tissierellales bacterium]